MLRLWRSLPGLGLLLGALLFAASLTPSLIPRAAVVQGVLGGVAFAAGYGLGVLLLWLWSFLELPVPSERRRRIAGWTGAAVALALVLFSLSRANHWQNEIRSTMGVAPVEKGHTLEVALLSVGIALVLILIGRLFLVLVRLVSVRLERRIPRRLAAAIGILVAAVAFGAVLEGVVWRAFLRTADASFRAFDALIEPEVPAPADPASTGSAASLVAWEDLGRAGREFVAGGPGEAGLRAFFGGEAERPVRVYAGLNVGNSTEERADLALRELIRVGGFERSAVVIAVPTGTGWMDPAAIDTLEYLLHGDVATVAMQYSYLTSWISLLAEPGYGTEAGRALFAAVYRHWHAMPRDARPRLYLYGLSLGAQSSQEALRLQEILGDPPQGVLWVGPPFSSRTWREATDEREPGSPPWRPRVGDGSFMRFTNRGEELDLGGAPWGPMRVVYLQYTSDPIVFFEPGAFWRKPAWLDDPRGPDVTPELRWYPVVTGLQLLVDLATGVQVPMGHGHLYSYVDHIEPWLQVTGAAGWTPEELGRLRAHLER